MTEKKFLKSILTGNPLYAAPNPLDAMKKFEQFAINLGGSNSLQAQRDRRKKARENNVEIRPYGILPPQQTIDKVISDRQDRQKREAGIAKGQELLDLAGGGEPYKFPTQPERQISPEGVLKGNQLSATASSPMNLGGVVDDVMAYGQEGKFQPAATPKAQEFMAKQEPRERPKFDPSKVVEKDASGNYYQVTDKDALISAERNFNMAQRQQDKSEALADRTDRRKDFASQLNAANYDPSKASSEDKAKFYEMGKSMGLSSDQIDSYANKQLDAQAERDYRRANMGKFLDTVDSRRSNRASVQGASGGLGRRRTGSNIRTSQADLDKEARRNRQL